MAEKKKRGPRYFGSKSTLGYIEGSFDNQRYYLHRFYAEALIGKKLPKGTVIHHVNGNTIEQAKNMVICENQGYHTLLHQRLRALKACGNPTWRKCTYCKQYDAPENMVKANNFCTCLVHKKCRYEAKLKWLERKQNG